MNMKRAARLLRIVMIGAVALAGVTGVGAQQASRSGVNPPTAAAMEQHWQSLIHERDPARQQALIAEHRRMMEEAQKADKDKRVPARGSETSAMMQDSGHHDLRNTIEMHSIMLDMME